MAKKVEPFVGWKGRTFVFVAPDGLRMRFSGPRAAVLAELRRCLPGFYQVALAQGLPLFAHQIHLAADNVGIVIYRVRELDGDEDGFCFEVVDGPSVHARVVGAFERESEADADAAQRNGFVGAGFQAVA